MGERMQDPLEFPGPEPSKTPDRFSNRELSWIDFASRVLEVAADPGLSILDRWRFVAIFATGLDEFFQVRVAGLKDQLLSAVTILSPDGLSPRGQLKAIRARLGEVLSELERFYADTLLPGLASTGYEILPLAELGSHGRARLAEEFERSVFPVLTPLSVDPSHPFPYISNLSLNLAVEVRDRVDREVRFARIKVPSNFPRLFPVSKNGFVLIEDLVSTFLHRLFPGMEIGESAIFRVTRNADLVLEEGEADDLLAAVETELRRRRFGRAVRLEVGAGASPAIEALLIEEHELHADDVYHSQVPLDLSLAWEVYKLDIEDARLPAAAGRIPEAFLGPFDEHGGLFGRLAVRDVLVHHPYESFSSSVEVFVSTAAKDPDVLAIKQTLYRTSGDSAIVHSLIEAAEAGKQVVVIVEVKARFDELANIGWARQLEEAGVHVVYGVVGLKTHCKAVMVVRREGSALRRYCHLGTGNYNARTARIYEDFGFFTARDEFGRDLGEVFNYLTGFSRPGVLDKLIVAPGELRTALLSLIAEETRKGPEGRIAFKVNSLVDPEVVDALYLASDAGVPVVGIVRGICSLRPGIDGLSEGITIRSIVGPFLEHSRIFLFGDPESESARIYLSSADIMQRNLDRRVELMFPIEDPNPRRQLASTFKLYLLDDSNSWSLGPSGTWKRRAKEGGISVQAELDRRPAASRGVPGA